MHPSDNLFLLPNSGFDTEALFGRGETALRLSSSATETENVSRFKGIIR
jgi:hypothetical protein